MEDFATLINLIDEMSKTQAKTIKAIAELNIVVGSLRDDVYRLKMRKLEKGIEELPSSDEPRNFQY